MLFSSENDYYFRSVCILLIDGNFFYLFLPFYLVKTKANTGEKIHKKIIKTYAKRQIESTAKKNLFITSDPSTPIIRYFSQLEINTVH